MIIACFIKAKETTPSNIEGLFASDIVHRLVFTLMCTVRYNLIRSYELSLVRVPLAAAKCVP